MDELEQGLSQLMMNATRGSGTFQGAVTAVSESQYTCTVEVGGEAEFLAVPLRVLIGSAASIVEIPVIGTTCLICFRDNNINFPQLVSCDRAAKILISSPLVQFNGGENGGMVIVGDLVTEINKIVSAFNQLNTKVNALAPTPVIPPLVSVSDSSFENTVITQ